MPSNLFELNPMGDVVLGPGGQSSVKFRSDATGETVSIYASSDEEVKKIYDDWQRDMEKAEVNSQGRPYNYTYQ